MTSMIDRNFHVIGGKTISEIMDKNHHLVVDFVSKAYCAFADGKAINPDSYFLRFPEKPSARIIALPAYLGDEFDLAGIKWIASFPGNHNLSLPRASATIILNNYETGMPYACLEGSIISATRTAASAVLGAELLHPSKKKARNLAIIGTGLISRKIVEFFVKTGWDIDEVTAHDLNEDNAKKFCEQISLEHDLKSSVNTSLTATIKSSDLVVFATTAPEPYFDKPEVFTPDKTVLHISLRDIGVDSILNSQNVVDDVDHALKANTSTHLAEQHVDHRQFIDGSITDLIRRKIKADPNRCRIFSPFGMGVLDLALAHFVHSVAIKEGKATCAPDFFYGA